MPEPRWPFFMTASLGIGLLMAWWPQMTATPSPPGSFSPSNIDWLLLFGWCVAWRCAGPSVWLALAWCGLVHDLFAGGRFGANAALFLVAGLLIGVWSSGGVGEQGWKTRWLSGGAVFLGVAFLRPALETTNFWLAYTSGELWSCFVTAMGTAALLPCVETILRMAGSLFWRSRDVLAYRNPKVIS